MAKTRKASGKGFSLFQRVWSPFEHLLMAGEEGTQQVGSTAGKIVQESIGAVRKVGSSVVSHADNAVRNLTRGKRQSGGKRGRKASRRAASRKASRRHRK